MEFKIRRRTSLKLIFRSKLLLIILVMLVLSGFGWAQENTIKESFPVDNPFNNHERIYEKSPECNCAESAEIPRESVKNEQEQEIDFSVIESDRKLPSFDLADDRAKRRIKEKNTGVVNPDEYPEPENPPQNKDEEKFHWKPALQQSVAFLSFQHGYRVLTQKETRGQLKGPFFRDWKRSVKSLRGWDDGNSFFINYVAHPLQGGLTGRIFVNNSDNAKKQEFGKSKAYWKSRMKAFAWTAVWSTQFELGPVSEANIGNVGLDQKSKWGTMAYGDFVVTPVVGTGLLIGEDAIDKYVLKNWFERKTKSKAKVRILRSFLTPTTSIGNLLRGKPPWKRDNRPLLISAIPINLLKHEKKN